MRVLWHLIHVVVATLWGGLAFWPPAIAMHMTFGHQPLLCALVCPPVCILALFLYWKCTESHPIATAIMMSLGIWVTCPLFTFEIGTVWRPALRGLSGLTKMTAYFPHYTYVISESNGFLVAIIVAIAFMGGVSLVLNGRNRDPTARGREIITTERLLLVPAEQSHLEADLAGRSALEEALDLCVPDSWPPAPELYDRQAIEYVVEKLKLGPEQAGWWMHYFVGRREAWGESLLLGVGGYKGPPAADGTVEIGYAILPEFRRRGLATEAAIGLVGNAFKHAEVETVAAETLPELVASIGVLEKAGFRFTGTGAEEGVTRYELSRRDHARQDGQ